MLIAAPSSTKHATKTRDPEMRQTRKGKSWHFGMQCHIGTDPHGLVHTLRTTDAAQADFTQLPELVHGLEESLHGDKAYYKGERSRGVRGSGRAILGESARRADAGARCAQSGAVARGEHPFLVVKVLWGFTKTRYRGLYKNTVRVRYKLVVPST